MVAHGEQPKVFFVKAYSRWVRGELHRVDGHVRSMSPPMSLRESPSQLTFGF
jgi:hypothetical protein